MFISIIYMQTIGRIGNSIPLQCIEPGKEDTFGGRRYIKQRFGIGSRSAYSNVLGERKRMSRKYDEQKQYLSHDK